MFLLIENAEIYAPEPRGKASVLIGGDMIMKIGDLPKSVIKKIDDELEVINAAGSLVAPGLIDPHQHLLGGSGESGFATQTPEISASEIIEGGITTVVGCLGVDTTMKTTAGLLAKTKGLKEEGLNAFMWAGGYNVPPTSITQSVRDDIMFIDEVIGTGEVALSDERSMEPTLDEIVHVAHDTYIGGMLSNKAGVVHFHIGKQETRLKMLFELLEKHQVKPEWLYPTHINRSDELVLEATDLAKRGSYVDIDTVDEDLYKWLSFYLDNGGPPDKITISSDASKTKPGNMFEQLRECVIKHKMPLETLLPMATKNTATVLKLPMKGAVAEGKAADVLVIKKKDLELSDVISGGRRLFKNGKLAFKERFLEDNNREITLVGKKAPKNNKASAAKS